MVRIIFIIAFLLISALSAAEDEKLPLYYDAGSYEYIRGLYRDTIFLTDGAVFQHGSSYLKSDTAILIKGEKVVLLNDVYLKDSIYTLIADRVEYFLDTRAAIAEGDSVIIISETDSMRASGTNAYYNRDSSIIRMAGRPLLELNYQDSALLTEVYANHLALDAESGIGYGDGDVIINRQDTQSKSDRAIMYADDEVLLLLGNPVARRNESEIKGDTLILFSENSRLKQIYVTGNGLGNFKEPSQDDSTQFDISELKAEIIEFNLEDDELNNINAVGQAYSYYYPAIKDSNEIVKNVVSGDTLRMKLENRGLNTVEVIGGAEGSYLTGTYKEEDSVIVFTEDTVGYRSDYILYSLQSSTISLDNYAAVNNKNVFLTARRIDYNTGEKLVFAYDDSIMVDTQQVYIPVILKDGSEEIVGSYLEYSMATEKGMIVKTRSDYQEAYYSGKELFRPKKDVYYVDDGTYSTCDAETPHFHFRSNNMKMIQGDKVIARPVIFYIDQLPLLIIPYYVFPTKPGRHSGFMSFKFGSFQQGNRYLSDVGYYWAPSDYWDASAFINYDEIYGIKYNTNFRYNVRYKYSGSIAGSYANESSPSGFTEFKKKRWEFTFNHRHTVSPTFNINASGRFVSDKSYYTDFSTDLEDRLNRDIRSQISFTKTFSGASLSGEFLHDVGLDSEKRTDRMPSLRFSLLSRPIFGSPGKDDDGRELRKWYHNFHSGYRVSLLNFSNRTTNQTINEKDRKKYTTVDHSASINGSFKLMKYLNFSPGMNYQETWYKVYKTDLSREAGINVSRAYGRTAYNASLRFNTKLYGTVNPQLFGLEGLRHTLTPSVSYSWAPEIDQHNTLRTFTGTGGGGAKQSTVSFSLNHQFQAKYKKDEQDKKIDLFTVNSTFGYNFENKYKPFSNLRTTISTNLLRNLNFQATMTHDFYKPDSNILSFWSPHLLTISFNTTFRTGGTLGSSGLRDSSFKAGGKGQEQRWSFSITHYYSETRSGNSFKKSHTASLGMDINLTSTIDLRYTQYYDFTRHTTIRRQVEISKNLHCWKGFFRWIPNGSGQGFYFLINVISIPAIKFEKTESDIRSAYF